MDRRDQDVRRQIVAQLHDQLGQIRLVCADAGLGQRLVQPDLLRRHRLDLDDLPLAGLPYQPGDDPVGLVGVRGPVDLPARGGDRGLQPLQIVVEMAQRTVLHRGARGPQLGPVVQLRNGLGPFVTDGVGGVGEVGAQLGVAGGRGGGPGKGGMPR